MIRKKGPRGKKFRSLGASAVRAIKKNIVLASRALPPFGPYLRRLSEALSGTLSCHGIGWYGEARGVVGRLGRDAYGAVDRGNSKAARAWCANGFLSSGWAILPTELYGYPLADARATYSAVVTLRVVVQHGPVVGRRERE